LPIVNRRGIADSFSQRRVIVPLITGIDKEGKEVSLAKTLGEMWSGERLLLLQIARLRYAIIPYLVIQCLVADLE